MVFTQAPGETDAPSPEAEALFKEARRRERRRRIVWAAAVVVLLGTVGSVVYFVIGNGAGSAGPTGSNPPPRPALSGTNPPHYQVVATVLQAPGQPAELCGSVAISLPPQCGGPAITNWDWGAVQGSTTVGGVTWGTYRLVGTYTHGRFTLTHPATPATYPPSTPVRTTPGCPEPPGGWPTANVTFEQYQRFTAAAQSPADFAGMWTTQQGPVADPGRDVYTVAYTGNIATHQADLRSIWPGPLCVVQRPRSMAQLRAVEQALMADPDGLQLLSVSVDQVNDILSVEAVLALPSDQQRLDHRFGAGIVRLTSQLQPLP